MVTGIVLILGGLLALSGKLLAKKPSMKKTFDLIMPYEGYIGVLLFVWGIVDIIHLLSYISTLLKASVLTGIIAIVAVVTELIVGFLLGYPLISKYALSKTGAKSQKKADAIKDKLLSVQMIFGILAIIFGILVIVY